ncbi:DNA-deoxyinosine glycosylase [Methylophaga sp. 42_25_T18]|nr:DNA-deoxyinosine glycosylase [Methylophaga sp. 42_25_T18]OUR87045.1 DNA-deoxyinosine glycosylase [Methylophaga sp. 42_8_T64]
MVEANIESISFAPIAAKDAGILILGSMPGIKSLQEQQYYAHPRNAFWPIMGKLYKFDLTLEYSARCQQLKYHQIAVWDVLKSCRRPGSLDQHIESDSMVANDFNSFLKQYKKIQHIFFNGGKAEQVFKRHVLPTLNVEQSLSFQLLPSTSPAHAALSFNDKLSQWQIIKQNYGG